MGSMIATSTDCCPRCGYALDQPAPPAPAAPPPAPPLPPVSSYAERYPAPAPAPARPSSGRQSSGLSAASVPKILLGLGATCLLVASVIFLAVAWSWLGVGGRTAVLVGLTLGSGLAGQWLARRDLGVAAEAFTTVALGLVVLDVLGAEHAGWLGDVSPATFLLVLGGSLLTVSLGLCLPGRRLFAPQVVAPLGLGAAVLGAGAQTTGGPVHLQVVAAAGVLAFTALALVGRALGTVVLPWTSTTGAGLAFLALTGSAVTDASTYPTLHGLWLQGHGVGMLAVAALVLLPWAVVRGHDDLRQLVCAGSASVLTFAAVLPVLDEGLSAVTLAAAACTVVWSVVAASAPPRWYAAPRVPLAGSLLALAPAPLVLAVQGAVNLLDVGPHFSAGWLVRLKPGPDLAHPLLLPLGVAVVVLAAALTVPRSGRFGYALLGLTALTGLLTAAHYALPLVLFVAVLGPAGVLIAFPSAVLTLVALAEVVVLAAYLAVRRRGPGSSLLGGLALPAALGAFLWVGGHVLGTPYAERSLVVLVVLGLLALAVPVLEVEAASAVVALSAAATAVPLASDVSVWLAVHLTVAGALVTLTGLLHRDHRPVAWLGGLLLASATWVRLLDLGVQAPEAYTLPSAGVLLLAGLVRMRRSPEVSSTTALLPGLCLAVVPTLLWALVDPLSARAVVIGAVCLLLLVGGAAVRWTAPVVVGWAAGAALVLRELAPYAERTPQWVVIAIAGTVLMAAGLSWEARVRDLRRTAAYLGRLR